MHDVFISYANENLNIAKAICARLEQEKIRCWYAKRDVPGGADYPQQIMDAIAGSRILVLVLSAHSNSSVHVEKEVERALSRGIAILPMRIDQSELSGGLEYLLSGTHWLDAITPPLEAHLKELKQAVVALLKPRKDPELVPPPPEPHSFSSTQLSLPRSRLPRWAVALLSVLVAIGGFAGYGWYRRSAHSLCSISNSCDTKAIPHDRRWDAFMGAIPWERWVIYDPTEYDPYRDQFPSEMSMREDLQALQSKGFKGLVTMSSRGALKNIARIAHETGFQMVIVGVWDLRNADEIAAALGISEYADAYCIGHRGLTKRYTFGELQKTVARFQEATGRPVAVSEILGEYESNQQLVALGDFLFPDVHPQWHEGETPEAAWAETVAAARKTAQLTSAFPDREILLKMVSFPSAGAPGLTPDAQARFYHYAVETARDNKDVPARVAFSFMGAFDTPWKTTNYGWTLPEQSTGLFTAKREPKPAVLNVHWTVTR
ncbi:MAG: TIR domain-containing protein [Terriglobales bacterium]|jgi:exo-beta-1,3-glucanase (GH17 family)